ncbi:MAG TPA: hypothetical protein VII99_09260, partial [Bacteroidia bacterium]
MMNTRVNVPAVMKNNQMKNPNICAADTISILTFFCLQCKFSNIIKRRYFILVIFFQLSCLLHAQDVIHTVFLIGDAGKDTLPGPVLQLLGHELSKNQNSSVVFLGDNIYPQGFDSDPLSEKKLHAQLSVLEGFTGNIFFVPGNHDWKAGKWQGKKCLKRE